MGRLVEQLELDNKDPDIPVFPENGLNHADARDRKTKGKFNSRSRFTLRLLDQALSLDIETQNPESKLASKRLREQAFRRIGVEGLERHRQVAWSARRLARRYPQEVDRWERFYRPNWSTVSINLNSIPERLIRPSGQEYIFPQDPFMARVFEHQGRALAQLARYLTHERVADMAVYFAARPIKVDTSVKNPKPEYRMRRLTQPGQLTAEAVTNMDVREVFSKTNTRTDATIRFAEVRVGDKVLLSLSYKPAKSVGELRPVISPEALTRMPKRKRLEITDKGIIPPKGEIKLGWQNTGVPFIPSQFSPLLLIDRAITTMLFLPDFIPATSQA